MLQPKDINWLAGHKNRTHIYAAYKRLIQIQRHIKNENEGIEKVFHANENQKKA